MSVEVLDDVRVVHVEGCATDDDLRDALAALAHHPGPTVLDLADLTLVGPGVPELVGGVLHACDAVAVTVRRTTAQVILSRSGVTQQCAVFTSIGDARQALRMAEAGYGAGWDGPMGAAG